MARAQQRTQLPAKQSPVANAAPPVTSAAPRPADVAARAYEIWQQSGCPHGKDKEHWFQAERELRARAALH